MKKITAALSALVFAASFAAARSPARARASVHHGISGRSGFSRKNSRSTFARALSPGASSRSGFAGSSLPRGRATFAGASLTGGGTGSPAPAPSNTTPGFATPGAKILTLGQAPVYSNAAGGGTASVSGGGFVAIDPTRATDVERGPGITWGTPDQTTASSGGGGGSGASSNGPASQPAF
jgi:hypothetical protein